MVINAIRSMSYYTDVDEMPLYNWRKCQEKGLYEYCRKGSNRLTEIRKKRKWFDSFVKLIRKPFYKDEKIEVLNETTDGHAWTKVYDSYLKEFGLGESYLRVLEYRRDIAILECEYAIDGNTFKRNLIVVKQEELKNYLATQKGGSITSALSSLSNWHKREINEREITVSRFYTMLNDLKIHVAKQKKNDKKNGNV